MLNNLGMAQETVDQMLPRLGDLLQINGEKSRSLIYSLFIALFVTTGTVLLVHRDEATGWKIGPLSARGPSPSALGFGAKTTGFGLTDGNQSKQ